MTRVAAIARIGFLLVAFAAASPALAFKPDRPWPKPENDLKTPKMMEGIQIDDKAGSQLPGDIKLRDQDGHEVLLSNYFDGARPVVLVLAYYGCPMLCTLVLNGMTESLKDLAWNAGESYRVITVSIDPRDTSAIAKEKRENYLKSYGRAVKPDAWDFLTGDADQTKRLADAVGFHYRWDPEQEQYAHAAGAFILTPGGKVSRTFYGIRFESKDLRLALAEASDGRFASAVDKLLLLCFHYDPHEGKYVLAARNIMMGGGIASVFGLGLAMALFFRGEARKHRNVRRPATV